MWAVQNRDTSKTNPNKIIELPLSQAGHRLCLQYKINTSALQYKKGSCRLVLSACWGRAKSHFSEQVTEICDFELPGILSFQTFIASDGIIAVQLSWSGLKKNNLESSSSFWHLNPLACGFIQNKLTVRSADPICASLSV